MKVVEMFTSIQGESSYTGRPCFFIRTAGCNLNCSYCDTEYAKSANDGKFFSIENLIEKAKTANTAIVEITGGEPLLQEGIEDLCRGLLAAGFTVLVETNGSVRISQLPEGIIRIVDCKTPSSGESERMDFANFADLKLYDEIKFVISNRNDYLYARDIIEKYRLNDKVENILFSPVASDSFSAAELSEWILGDHLNVRLQLQLHKIIWSPEERGR